MCRGFTKWLRTTSDFVISSRLLSGASSNGRAASHCPAFLKRLGATLTGHREEYREKMSESLYEDRQRLWKRWQAFRYEQKQAIAYTAFCVAYGALQRSASNEAKTFFERVAIAVTTEEGK